MSSTFYRLVSGSILAVTCAGSVSAQTSEFGWHDDLSRGIVAARESGRPLMIVFRCVR